MSNVPEQPETVTPQAGGWVNAALAIACGHTASAAARTAGVCLRTIRRWSKRPAFQALVEKIREEMLNATLGKLIDKNAAAVETLAALLNDDQGSIRLGAASRLLDLTLKVRHQLDTEKRIASIEDNLAKLRRERPELFWSENGNLQET